MSDHEPFPPSYHYFQHKNRNNNKRRTQLHFLISSREEGIAAGHRSRARAHKRGRQGWMPALGARGHERERRGWTSRLGREGTSGSIEGWGVIAHDSRKRGGDLEKEGSIGAGRVVSAWAYAP